MTAWIRSVAAPTAAPFALRRVLGGMILLGAVLTLALTGCATFSIMSTVAIAPDLRPSRVDELPDSFGDEILTFIVWERFEYIYGEGGEQTLALILAPPKVLRRSDLSHLGRHTKNFSYSRKTVDGTDEG